MANITITNIDTGSIIVEAESWQDDTLTFPGADSYVVGTILARKAVADAVTASAFTGTGDGTLTLATVAAGSIIPIVGAYTLTCTTAVTNGGIFSLTDPNGAIVATGLEMTAGAGAATAFEVAGLSFTVTDGATDFVAGDFATLTVAADGTLVVFSKTGAGGAQIPNTVLTYAVDATGAGTKAIRIPMEATVVKEDLIIDADGTGANVDAAVIDQLRDYGIFAVSVTELGNYDNQ